MKITRGLSVLLMFIFFYQFASAQYFWRISGNGLKSDSYLLGTMHLAPYSFAEAIPGLMEIMEEVDAVCSEVNFFSSEADSTQTPAFFPQGASLKDICTDDEYERIVSYLESLTGTRYKLIKFTPFGLMMYIINYKEQQNTLGKTIFMDFGIQSQANDSGKPIYAFESLQEQKIMLGNVSDYRAQLNALLEYIDMQQYDNDIITSMYLNGDFDGIKLIMSNYVKTEKGLKIVNERNIKWMSTLLSLIEKQSTLIAVGAGHLFNDYGLIALLHQCGYTVEPLE